MLSTVDPWGGPGRMQYHRSCCLDCPVALVPELSRVAELVRQGYALSIDGTS